MSGRDTETSRDWLVIKLLGREWSKRCKRQ